MKGVVFGQGDSGASAWASRDSGVRTGGQCMGLQGQWCVDRGTVLVVHQHGPCSVSEYCETDNIGVLGQ